MSVTQAMPIGTNTIPTTGFLRLRQIIGDAKRGLPTLIPVSKSTWWQGVKDGKFPAPVKLGPRMAAWRVEEIRALLACLAEGETWKPNEI